MGDVLNGRLLSLLTRRLVEVGLGGKKHDQHYVWQFYLRPWTIEGALWVRRNGRVFSTGTRRIAFEKDFYQVHRLESNDIQLLRDLFILPSHPSARPLHEQLINYMTALNFLEGLSSSTDHLIDIWRNNALENYHAAIERDFIPLLERARQRDISFYEDQTECMIFLRFITMQYFRTKKIRKSVIDGLMNFNGVDLSRIWTIASFMCASNLGANLFLERNKRRLILLKNDNSRGFLTCDQPTLNLSPKEEGRVIGCIMYYPISENLALILTEKDGNFTFSSDTLTIKDVEYLNNVVMAASHDMIFAKYADLLQL